MEPITVMTLPASAIIILLILAMAIISRIGKDIDKRKDHY